MVWDGINLVRFLSISILFVIVISSFSSVVLANSDSFVSKQDFYESFFDNPRINVVALNEDGVKESYTIDLDVGVVKEGSFSFPDATLNLDQEILFELLDSNSWLDDLYSDIKDDSVSYTLNEPLSLFGSFINSITGFFTFGGN